MMYDLHGMDPGRVYVTYFVGDGGLVVKADKEAQGCWLKHLLEVSYAGFTLVLPSFIYLNITLDE